MAELLDQTTVARYLAGRGLIGATAQAEVLAGGISNIVLGVGDVTRRLVVKQSLPRLRVADDWPAPISRVLTEADALELAARLTPGQVPVVVDRDEGRHAVVVERAPDDWQDWKTLLLAGEVDAGVARRLGEVLARWHTATTEHTELSSRFDDTEAFEQLRVDPYYRTVARRAPELARPVDAVIDRMLATRMCLVHGDFSPKNVLVGPDVGSGGLWVIDFEVAHIGDPAFDLAFLLTHLTLKSLHRPELAALYDRAAAAFADAYDGGVGEKLAADWPYVLQHVGCMLLARIRGKSPAEYLTEPQRDEAWRLGLAVLAARPNTPADLVRHRDEARA